MTVIKSTLLVILGTFALFAQNAPSHPEFEVASVKRSAPAVPGRVNIGVHVDGALVNCNYLALKDYIRTAYRMKEYQIIGPDWIASERYDISAKLPAGASREQVPEMLQALLADRFKLTCHRDSKEMPVYALVVGKGGPKLKESPPDPPGDAPSAKDPVEVTVNAGRGGTAVNLGKGASMNFGAKSVEATKVTMPALADSLVRFFDRPVVDMTGLTGRYDFTLQFSWDELRVLVSKSGTGRQIPASPPDGDAGISVFDSLQNLGLKLDSRKAPVEVLVVDHAEKTPTEN